MVIMCLNKIGIYIVFVIVGYWDSYSDTMILIEPSNKLNCCCLLIVRKKVYSLIAMPYEDATIKGGNVLDAHTKND